MVGYFALSKIENRQRPVMSVEVVALVKAIRMPLAWLFADEELSLAHQLVRMQATSRFCLLAEMR